MNTNLYVNLSWYVIFTLIIIIGRWSESGLFKKFLDELLTKHMSSIIGSYSLHDIERLRIYSHSGGYYTIGNMAIVGDVDQVYELCLLDSLYADFQQFDLFVTKNIQNFGLNRNNYRFSSIFSLNGGTKENNENMAQRAILWTNDNNCSDILIFDESDKNNYINVIDEYSLIFKYTTLVHDDIPRKLFYDFLITAL